MANFKCRVNGLFGGVTPWSYGFNCTASTDVNTVAATLQSASTTFWTTATNGYAHQVTADVESTSVTAYEVNASWRTISKKTLAMSFVGDASGNSLPWYTSVTLFNIGADDSKSDRGFIKLPAPAESKVAAHVYTSGFITSLEAIIGQFWTDMSALTAFTLVSYNRHTNKMGEPPFTLHTLTNTLPSNKPGTNKQRTRKILPTYGAAIPVP